MAIYGTHKIHPWILFLQKNSQKIDYNLVTKSNELLRKIYNPIIFKIKENFGKIEFLDSSERTSNENLEKLKQRLILQLSNSNQNLVEDLQKKHKSEESGSNLENSYHEIIKKLNTIFDKIQNNISSNRKVLTNSFIMDIHDLGNKVIDPFINKTILSSKLNKEVAFLDRNFNIVYAKLFDLGLVLKLIPMKYHQRKLIYFNFLDEKFYRGTKHLMVI